MIVARHAIEKGKKGEGTVFEGLGVSDALLLVQDILTGFHMCRPHSRGAGVTEKRLGSCWRGGFANF